MLIDTHAHVNFEGFKDEYKEVLARAKEAGVLVVNVGTQLDTSASAVKMAEEFGLYAVVGLHPVHTYSQNLDEEETHFKTREEKFDYEAYRKLASNPLVVGIGECGLDYYRLPLSPDGHHQGDLGAIKKLQKDVFVAQIRLAKELGKALVIHCRPSVGSQDAYEDVLTILDQELQIPNNKVQMTKGNAPIDQLRFEIHSFTGSPEIVQEFLRRGAYVGMNGIITFDRTGNMEAVVKTVPLDRIVLETDCPFLTPVPFRGKKNEPAYVQYVAQKVAELKDVVQNEVAVQTTRNAKALFAIR
jgi:TatD DNase family protein